MQQEATSQPQLGAASQQTGAGAQQGAGATTGAQQGAGATTGAQHGAATGAQHGAGASQQTGAGAQHWRLAKRLLRPANKRGRAQGSQLTSQAQLGATSQPHELAVRQPNKPAWALAGAKQQTAATAKTATNRIDIECLNFQIQTGWWYVAGNFDWLASAELATVEVLGQMSGRRCRTTSLRHEFDSSFPHD